MKSPTFHVVALVVALALTFGCASETTASRKKPAATASIPAVGPSPAPKAARVAAVKQAPTPLAPPVDLAAVDIKPSPYRQIRATYPHELQKSGASGKVLLSFVLDPEGKPTQIKSIEATNDFFAKEAIDALERWRFYPAQKDGLPVACNMQQLFTFTGSASH